MPTTSDLPEITGTWIKARLSNTLQNLNCGEVNSTADGGCAFRSDQRPETVAYLTADEVRALFAEIKAGTAILTAAKGFEIWTGRRPDVVVYFDPTETYAFFDGVRSGEFDDQVSGSSAATTAVR
jgi:hypothetical protein